MSLYMQQEQGRQDGNHTDASRSYNPSTLKHKTSAHNTSDPSHKRPLTQQHKGALIRSNLITNHSLRYELSILLALSAHHR